MLRSMLISATGMSAQQLAMDAIANNLANVNTTGFKTSQAKFADLFYQAVDEANAPGMGQGEAGLGVQNVAMQKVFTQGEIISTGNTLDLAIQGEGFFQVLRPDGSLGYTRDGALRVNADGVLCTAQGQALVPEISIPNDAVEIKIAADGTVWARRASENQVKAQGQLELARFVNPGGLVQLGQNLLAASEASGEAQVNTPGQEGAGTLLPGSLERSNVNLVQEMVNLITVQRAYEINTKSIQAADEMMKMTNNLRR